MWIVSLYTNRNRTRWKLLDPEIFLETSESRQNLKSLTTRLPPTNLAVFRSIVYIFKSNRKRAVFHARNISYNQDKRKLIKPTKIIKGSFWINRRAKVNSILSYQKWIPAEIWTSIWGKYLKILYTGTNSSFSSFFTLAVKHFSQSDTFVRVLSSYFSAASNFLAPPLRSRFFKPQFLLSR